MENHTEKYMEEANELLLELENSLLELDENPEDAELLGRIFRALHTIKGSGSMFGFDDIAEFTHKLESAFDLVREGKVKATKDLINISLAARDHIKVMLDAYEGAEKADPAVARDILLSLERTIPNELSSYGVGGEEEQGYSFFEENEEREKGETTYRIRFIPGANIFKRGVQPILLLKELQDLGHCNIFALTGDIPPLEDMDSCACYTSWDIILTTRKDMNAIRDVFIFVEDESDIKIDVIVDEEGIEDEGALKKLGEILLERGDITAQTLDNILKDQADDDRKRLGAMLVEAELLNREVVNSALHEQRHVKSVQDTHRKAILSSSVRVPEEKLDSLINLVGELVTVQTRLSRAVAGQKSYLYDMDEEQRTTEINEEMDVELSSISEEVERLTGELRKSTMDIRMLPIGTTFNRFRRMVRDLSVELGKDVVLKTEGGETRLDKTVIEKLTDPLMHIIRNAIDHGVEKPALRKASGKPVQGTVRMLAEHSGAYVLITISDDGAGFSPDRIYEKALSKGLIDPEASLTEKEMVSLALTPGFSTAQEVTSISGRGVGLDVVSREIESLQGSIEIAGKKGEGTKIILKMPLTLAIIDGLMVGIGNEKYIIPLSAVEECLELAPKESEKAEKRGMINLRGDIVPYVNIRDIFQINESSHSVQRVVIAGAKGERIGLGVDVVIGGHQTVIKALGKAYKEIKNISGATVLGDGTVALILDVNQLMRTVESSA